MTLFFGFLDSDDDDDSDDDSDSDGDIYTLLVSDASLFVVNLYP